MAKYSKEDILRIVKEEDIKFVRLQFTDVLGTLKNVAVTVSAQQGGEIYMRYLHTSRRAF